MTHGNTKIKEQNIIQRNFIWPERQDNFAKKKKNYCKQTFQRFMKPDFVEFL